MVASPDEGRCACAGGERLAGRGRQGGREACSGAGTSLIHRPLHPPLSPLHLSPRRARSAGPRRTRRSPAARRTRAARARPSAARRRRPRRRPRAPGRARGAARRASSSSSSSRRRRAPCPSAEAAPPRRATRGVQTQTRATGGAVGGSRPPACDRTEEPWFLAPTNPRPLAASDRLTDRIGNSIDGRDDDRCAKAVVGDVRARAGPVHAMEGVHEMASSCSTVKRKSVVPKATMGA